MGTSANNRRRLRTRDVSDGQGYETLKTSQNMITAGMRSMADDERRLQTQDDEDDSGDEDHEDDSDSDGVL